VEAAAAEEEATEAISWQQIKACSNVVCGLSRRERLKIDFSERRLSENHDFYLGFTNF
jgi:hypothetical protein